MKPFVCSIVNGMVKMPMSRNIEKSVNNDECLYKME